MLRIKSSEWQRFCDNAESLGFNIDNGKNYFSYRCFVAKEYLEITKDSIYIIGYDESEYITSTCLEKLYDLIIQGYVEKVEE